MSEGVVALWIAGRRRGRARRGARRRPRLPGGAAVNVRFGPGAVRLRGADRPAGRQVDLAPRRDRRRDGLRAGPDHQLPRRRRHPLDARGRRATLGAIVEARDGELLIRGVRDAQRPAAERRDRRRQRRDADAPAARLAGLPAGQQLHAGRRRLDPPPPGRPDRRAAARDGRAVEAREGRFAPFTSTARSLHGIDYELPVASAQVKSCVLLAGLATARTTRARADRRPAITPSGCCCAAGAPVDARGAARRRLRSERRQLPTSSSSSTSPCPATCPAPRS